MKYKRHWKLKQFVLGNSGPEFVVVQSVVWKHVASGLVQGKGSSHEEARGAAWDCSGEKKGEGNKGREDHHSKDSILVEKWWWGS